MQKGRKNGSVLLLPLAPRKGKSTLGFKRGEEGIVRIPSRLMQTKLTWGLLKNYKTMGMVG